MKLNRQYNMDCRVGLKQMITDKQQVDTVITSPPYYKTRDYGIPPSIWDGDLECDHNFEEISYKANTGMIGFQERIQKEKNSGTKLTKLERPKEITTGFCSKCNAFKGTLGLEPNISLYISHLCDIYDLIWRVLKDTGTNWVNMGITMENKCDLMIPERFAIEMCERGWIKRRTNIWQKPNAMPSSVKDDFTLDFEYIYFFVKSNKNQYWINKKTSQLVSKQPLGIYGIENSDWEWRECPKCDGTGIEYKECTACEGEGWIYNNILQLIKCSECKGLGKIIQKEICKRCKGLEKIKYNFWNGKTYYFEQQLEKANAEIIFSRNSKKGGVQEVNNPRIRWGNTREELRKRGFKIKNDKIKNPQYYGKEINYPTLTRNKRCVWSISTKPNPALHFATFPDKLVETPILAGCPKYVCSKCGKPREKIIENKYIYHSSYNGRYIKGFGSLPAESARGFKNVSYKNPIFKDYSDCGCNAKFIPGVVLDPFAGIGTALKVAYSLGRNYIGFDISKEYCDIFDKWYKNQSIRLDKWLEVSN